MIDSELTVFSIRCRNIAISEPDYHFKSIDAEVGGADGQQSACALLPAGDANKSVQVLKTRERSAKKSKHHNRYSVQEIPTTLDKPQPKLHFR